MRGLDIKNDNPSDGGGRLWRGSGLSPHIIYIYIYMYSLCGVKCRVVGWKTKEKSEKLIKKFNMLRFCL